MILVETMQKNENVLNNSSFSALTSFHFVAKFCANLVNSTSMTEMKSDVYGLGSEANLRKEEEAVADLFLYEAMRTFGDRVMRPTAKKLLLEKLSHLAQKEFLCPESYTPAYIEQLILGDYSRKEDAAHIKYTSVMTRLQRDETIA